MIFMIIFLYGLDSFRSQQKLKELKQKYIKEIDKSGHSLGIVDGIDMTMSKLNDLMASNSLFVAKRLIIIKNIFSNSDKEFLIDLYKYLQGQTDNQNIIIFYDDQLTVKSQKNKNEILLKEKKLNKAGQNLFDWLTKQQFVQHFPLLNNTEIANWIKDKLNKQGLQINYQAIQLIIGLLGNDLWLINNELDKLVNYKQASCAALENNQAIETEQAEQLLEISVVDVEEMVKGQLDHGIFALTDAISNKNKAQAVKLLAEQIQLGVADYYLITMLARQFRILLQIRQGLDSGWSSRKIGSQLGLHPYVLQKGINQARNFNLASLKTVFSALVKMDYNYKTGRLNVETMADLLIINF